MVDRTLLRKAFQDIQLASNLVEIIRKLHVDALYKMTVGGADFFIKTKRGIKQGCKLAPSFCAIAAGLFYQRVKSILGDSQAGKLLTSYADDTLLQEGPRGLKSRGQKFVLHPRLPTP